MSHYARIDENNIVQEVLVIDQETIDTGAFGDPSRWIQTSYNTYANVHLLGGEPLRKNFAAVGDTYSAELDAFIAPKPFASWQLNTETGTWQAPVAEPQSADPLLRYYWDESLGIWVETTIGVYPGSAQ